MPDDINSDSDRPGALDPSVLAELRELDPGGTEKLVETVVASFLRDAQARLNDIRDAVSRQEGPPLRQVAHALKGSSGCVGAIGMASLSAQLQEAAEIGAFHKAVDLAGQLENEFLRVRLILES